MYEHPVQSTSAAVIQLLLYLANRKEKWRRVDGGPHLSSSSETISSK